MNPEKKEKVFCDGLMFKRPREGAPEYIKGSVSIKVDDFVMFLKKHNNNGWVNCDLKESASTKKLYFELNTWKPNDEAKPLPSELSGEEKAEIVRMKEQDKANMEATKAYEAMSSDVINPDDVSF